MKGCLWGAGLLVPGNAKIPKYVEQAQGTARVAPGAEESRQIMKNYDQILGHQESCQRL